MTDTQTVIVTGGASGIGFAFSDYLLGQGYQVVVADRIGAPEAAEKLSAQGRACLGTNTDVSSAEHVAEMVERTLSAFGSIDALVNNAALFSTLGLRPFEQISNEEWMTVMAVNTLGPFMCAKAVLPAMRQKGRGRIVNIASTVPVKGTPLMSHYSASKGAIIGLTRSLARELGPQGITVNAIAPGFTLSEGVLRHDIHTQMGETTRKLSRSIPRDQVPGDLVGTLGFLISDAAAFITGQTIAVDGGSVFL